MTIQEYVDQLNVKFKSGKATEHSHRGNLEALLQSLLPDLLVTNEPTRVECGAPDYILTKGNIPVGYIEAKDIGEPLEGKKHKEQFERYKASLPNLIFTDYLDFHLYRDGEFVTSVRIADIQDGKIVGKPEKFAEFENLIKEFGTHVGQTIRSSSKLSKMMAGKARLLATIIENALNADKEKTDRVNESANNTLREQLSAFQNVLIHDIKAKEFADIYAQTIAYGMFAARLHDPTLETFSRQEAAELIPKTNPFLRKLFHYIAGYDLDDRIAWVVDGLADIFRATDVDGLLRNFGKATQQQDPIIHFYETFLAEYDPKLRKSRGVWYTPGPVVNFIVRAVDDILKDEFGLKDGLADTTKTTVKVNTDVKDKRSPTGYKQEEREVHKVQILDPAAGTGTFLAEVIKQIHKKFEGQQGIWEKYVEEHLIPRLNGFEILMASYAMAHLKLDLLLRETGVEPSGSQRFRVYLTNSLEEHHPDTGTLFANWLSEEANEANHVKRDTPVMVVLGNPPYSVSSQNKGEWIQNLIADYKKGLNERKLNLDDDYIKFIRYGEHLINKNGEGVLAYISNNSFIDGTNHRQMRKHLTETFNKIFILDLHGSSMKSETTSGGEKDENVFDIQQGVSINIFLKKNNDNNECKTYHRSILGRRDEKYSFLMNEKFESSFNEKFESRKPHYFLKPFKYKLEKKYNNGFQLTDIFNNYNSGLHSKRDALVFLDSEKKVHSLVEKFRDSEIEELRKIYNLPKDSRDWKIHLAKEDLSNSYLPLKVQYRLFSNKFIPYTGNSKGILAYPRSSVTDHFIKNNVGLVFKRTGKVYGQSYDFIFVSETMVSEGLFKIDPLGREYIAPLYLYPEESTQQTLDGKPERTPNLDQKIVQEIAKKLGLKFVPEKETLIVEKEDDPEGGAKTTFAPIDLLDYIYAVLHSPSYREKYKEFLKIDFPRVPYPEDPEQFWQLVELGGELRQIHLLEHPVVEDFITTYPESGSNIISNRLTKNDPGFIPDEEDETTGKVWINEQQYFGNVPKKAWEFYIGGYQPAEKWLKDRRDRELTFQEIQHYQKIIVALMETDRIMREIEKLKIL